MQQRVNVEARTDTTGGNSYTANFCECVLALLIMQRCHKGLHFNYNKQGEGTIHLFVVFWHVHWCIPKEQDLTDYVTYACHRVPTSSVCSPNAHNGVLGASVNLIVWIGSDLRCILYSKEYAESKVFAVNCGSSQ